MKIINEKGKLFGIINVVDLLALLAVIAVAAGVACKLFAPSIQDASSPLVEMTTIVRVRGATPFLQAEVQRNSPVGKRMVAGNDYVDGDIVDMHFEDYVIQTALDDGTIVDTKDPTKKDIVFTIKSQVRKDTPTPKIGSQEVRAGRTFTVKTNDFETSGLIVLVDIADE